MIHIPDRSITMLTDVQTAQLQTLREVLGSLGETADIVDGCLAARGIKGLVGSSAECPIARLARSILGADWTVLAGHAWLDLDYHGAGVIIDYPRSVVRFVDSFDSGAYPDLEHNPASEGPTILKTT
jgi:hypothetical protein